MASELGFQCPRCGTWHYGPCPTMIAEALNRHDAQLRAQLQAAEQRLETAIALLREWRREYGPERYRSDAIPATGSLAARTEALLAEVTPC